MGRENTGTKQMRRIERERRPGKKRDGGGLIQKGDVGVAFGGGGGGGEQRRLKN